MEHPKVTFKNGQQVAALGQGTYQMGQSWLKKREEINALRAGIDLGMNVIDTAERYENEKLVGAAIRGVRDKVFLVSKVQPFKARLRKTIMVACEQSLKKLKTDYLDLYLLHWKASSSTEETVAAMTKLHEDGKIRMWGVSNMDVPKMEQFFAIPEGDTCAADQVRYNISARDTECDLIPWCADRHVVFMAYSPIGEGQLIRNETLMEIGRRHNATAAQVALAWSVRNPNILSIPKAGSSRHVVENFKSLSIQLTEQDINELDHSFPPPNRTLLSDESSIAT